MNDSWGTPPDLIRAAEDFYRVQVGFDLAANGKNAKHPYYFTEQDNALAHNWATVWKIYCSSAPSRAMWLNPPYSRQLIKAFMGKVAEENNRSVSESSTWLLALIRFDPSARWFQECVDGVAYEVLMLPRRVKFQGADAAYNFPVCVAAYDGQCGPTTYNLVKHLKWSQ